MPLDDLFTLIKDLRERMDTHGAALRQSEALTRYALIDPLLRALGWNTADPALVVPEYRSGSGSADYALLGNGKPLMMVEAKKLDTPLRDVVGQGIQYCLIQGTAHFSVTDGRRWEIYETHRPVPIDDKRIASFDLKEQDPAEAALQALALWRPGVQAGHVTPGHPPVVVPTPVRPDPVPKPTPLPPPPPPDGYEWKPLPEVNPPLGAAHPVAIRFPDNTTVPAKAWNSILVESVRWLFDGNYLNTTHCPIRVRNGTRYVVATTPVHSKGSQFKNDVRVGPLHVETNLTSLECAKLALHIIEGLDQDPSRFHVGFAPGDSPAG